MGQFQVALKAGSRALVAKVPSLGALQLPTACVMQLLPPEQERQAPLVSWHSLAARSSRSRGGSRVPVIEVRAARFVGALQPPGVADAPWGGNQIVT